jgi:hypothetical protein
MPMDKNEEPSEGSPFLNRPGLTFEGQVQVIEVPKEPTAPYPDGILGRRGNCLTCGQLIEQPRKINASVDRQLKRSPEATVDF